MGEIEGRDQVIALIRSFLDHSGVTQHLLGDIIINVSGDSVTSQSYVSDMHLGRDGESSFRTLGNYSDQ